MFWYYLVCIAIKIRSWVRGNEAYIHETFHMPAHDNKFTTKIVITLWQPYTKQLSQQFWCHQLLPANAWMPVRQILENEKIAFNSHLLEWAWDWKSRFQKRTKSLIFSRHLFAFPTWHFKLTPSWLCGHNSSQSKASCWATWRGYAALLHVTL